MLLVTLQLPKMPLREFGKSSALEGSVSFLLLELTVFHFVCLSVCLCLFVLTDGKLLNL